MTREQVYQSVEPDIRRFVRGKYGLRNFEDRLQEALMAVWEHLPKFDPSNKNANLRTWCVKAADNAVLAEIKKEKWYNPGATRTVKALNQCLKTMIQQRNYFAVTKVQELIDQERQKAYVGSLYEVVSHEDEESFIIDLLPQPDEEPRETDFINELLAILSPTQQLIIIMYDLMGISMEDVAPVVYPIGKGRTVQALYVQRNNAIQTMRKVANAQAGNKNGHGGTKEQTDNQLLLSTVR